MKSKLKNTSKILFSLLLIFSIFSTLNVLAEEVVFKVIGVEVSDKTDGVIVNDVSLNNDNITNDVVFTNKDDYIKYNITIKNNGDKKYTIKSISDNNESVNLDYSYDDLSGVVLDKNEEKNFLLTITYVNESSIASISNEDVKLSLTYEDEDGNVTSSDVTNINNPNTGDNVYIYILLGTISLIGLGVSFSNKKKLSKSLMVIGITSTMIIPFMVNAKDDSFNIIFNNSINAREYTVSFNTNGGSSINSIKVVKGGTVTKPSDPSKDNNDFKGWYTTSELSTEFNFSNTKINSDTEIFAKWEESLPYTIISGDINTKGSIIDIGGEQFELIKNYGSKISMLALYPLNIGANQKDDDKKGLQDETLDDAYSYGKITFSDTVYWMDGSNVKDEYASSNYVYDENSNAYQYIEDYVDYLQDINPKVLSGRLWSDEESNVFNCSSSERMCWGMENPRNYVAMTGLRFGDSSLLRYSSNERYDRNNYDIKMFVIPVVEMSIE